MPDSGETPADCPRLLPERSMPSSGISFMTIPDVASSALSQRDSDLRFATLQSELGRLLVAWSGRGVRWVALGDDDQGLISALLAADPHAQPVTPTGDLARELAEIRALAADPARSCAVRLDLAGTPFQHAVWSALRKIPPGSTRTYIQIARSIGRPNAARAVGSACGANTAALLIPCHRALRSDGSLGGYRWGLERKRRLLAREAALSRPSS
jgi:AraC family transcriptional regulator of adaptative response/methylated-DNA-[protein]-cysteine methyltransferase